MATFSYQPPPAANAIRDAVWTGSTRELTAGGLDAIATTYPAGVADSFPKMVVATFYRFFGKVTKTDTQIKTFASNGTTVVTTQAISDSSGTETQGPAS
jgi:hypothetical protein